jgi:hypothetical protein
MIGFIRKRKIRKRGILTFFLLLMTVIGGAFLVRSYLLTFHNQQERQLKKALRGQECLIDYAIEESTAYTIVSSISRRDYGDTFVVFQEDSTGSWERIYGNDFKLLKPWKLELADVDGDGITDILTGVCKSTYYDKTEKNRLFIFNFSEHKLVKKWTGSQIAGLWEDFVTGDLLETKGDEVVFITRTDHGGKKLKLFSWFDFGFLMLAEGEEYDDITELTIGEENRMSMTCSRSKKEMQITLSVRDGKIVPGME